MTSPDPTKPRPEDAPRFRILPDKNDRRGGPAPAAAAAGGEAGAPPPPATLKPRKERFCREYLQDLNGTRAALRAGFSQRAAAAEACGLLAKPEVAAYIAQLKADRAKRLQLDSDWVVARLCVVVERCLQSRQVYDGQGIPVVLHSRKGGVVPVHHFDPAGATRALELLGRHLGIFAADNRQRQEAAPSTEALIRMLWERETPERRAEWMRAVEVEIDAVTPAGGPGEAAEDRAAEE